MIDNASTDFEIRRFRASLHRILMSWRTNDCRLGMVCTDSLLSFHSARSKHKSLSIKWKVVKSDLKEHFMLINHTIFGSISDMGHNARKTQGSSREMRNFKSLGPGCSTLSDMAMRSVLCNSYSINTENLANVCRLSDSTILSLGAMLDAMSMSVAAMA